MAAFIVDGSASWAYTIVLTAYVFERTGSPGWLTAMATARWVSAMVFGVYGGLLADRFDRRTVLVISALASAVVTVGMAVIVGLDGPLWLLLLAAAALGAVTTPVVPASGALIPEVVPESDLIAANAIVALLEGLIVVLGPAIGGVLLLTGHPVYGVLINTAGFLIATVLYLLLRVRSRGSAEPGGNVISQWMAGISSLRSHRRALVLTVFLVLDSAAISGTNVMMPASRNISGRHHRLQPADRRQRTGQRCRRRAGEQAGRIPARRVDHHRRVVPAMRSVVDQRLRGSIPPALVLMVISGVGMVIVDVLAFTALQRDLPSDVLGRVLGTINVLILGGSVLTAVLGSVLYAQLGLGWALGVIALAFPTIEVILGLPMLRRGRPRRRPRRRPGTTTGPAGEAGPVRRRAPWPVGAGSPPRRGADRSRRRGDHSSGRTIRRPLAPRRWRTDDQRRGRPRRTHRTARPSSRRDMWANSA